MTYREVINRLKAGLQAPARVTFNNVRTLDRLAGSISRRLELDSASLAGLLLADSTAARYGYTPQTFLAMFIPNTYELYWNCSSDEFLSRMQRENERFWQSRERKLARTGLNRIEAYTLASIVYEETKRTDEMPRVAGVYINRLKRGMPLQADPTVRFALGDFRSGGAEQASRSRFPLQHLPASGSAARADLHAVDRCDRCRARLRKPRLSLFLRQGRPVGLSCLRAIARRA